MLTIADLGLPPGFNGQGVHYNPVPVADPDSPDARTKQEADFALMAEHHITLVVVINPTWWIYFLAKKYGMFILSRGAHNNDEPWTNYGSGEAARSQGQTWAEQVDNETVIEPGNHNLDQCARLLVQASMQIYDAGGIVCWNLFDLPYFKYCVGIVHEYQAEKIFERFIGILHNYGINHPPNYIQDESGFLQFLFWAKWCKEIIGKVPFMIGGEWGWGLNESKDDRYPPISMELRNQYEQSCYEALKTGYLVVSEELKAEYARVCSYLPLRTFLPLDETVIPIPDEWLGQAKWIWNNEWRQAWHDDALVKMDGSRVEPWFQSMKARGPFVRKFSWDSVPEPQPEPTPIEEDPMPKDNLVTVLHNMWTRQGVNVPLDDGFFKHAVEQAKTNGVYVIPQPSPDGNYTLDIDGYRIAYTMPPMYAQIGDWGNVQTGLPF